MSDTSGSLIRHAARAACLLLVATGTSAQTPVEAPPAPGFITRYDFHLSAASLAIDDVRYSWDSRFGGDLDLVDYVNGRTSILIDYEVLLGDELRSFDPTQAYYTLQVSSSYRLRGTEIAGLFHHVSRHLSDRAKEFPIAWNMVGARVLRRVAVGRTTLDARAEAGPVVQHSHVDYTWTANLDLMIRHGVSPRVGVFAHGYGELYGVDSTIHQRTTQRGGLVEAGVRIDGRAGALELFAGFENRIDADPESLLPKRWGLFGFRLLGR